MQFQAVLFDLGGTLFRYQDVREHFDEMLKELAKRHGMSAPFGADPDGLPPGDGRADAGLSRQALLPAPRSVLRGS